ncbi:MAG: hypothetical protein L0K27_12765, partial [Corynebacterium nuruki]|nr:hypothetical protein [Corynebacterium nuruki]
MSHYDLYTSLGLDRTAPTTALATDIDRRIADLGAAGGARYSELRTARAVLGDDGRRRLYDQQLDNPAAPEITVADVEELAAMPVAATDGPPSGYTREIPVGPPPVTAAPAAAATARSPWVVPAAVATVVVAVAAVVIVWLVTSGGSDNAAPAPDADFRESTTTSSPAPVPDTSAAPSQAPSS